MIATPNRTGVRTDKHHVVAGEKRPHHRRLDLAVLCNGAHLQIISYDEMLKSEFTAQEVRDDVAAKRCRFQQPARKTLDDVDVWKAAVAYHHATYAIVLALKKFNVWCEVLRHQVIM